MKHSKITPFYGIAFFINPDLQIIDPNDNNRSIYGLVKPGDIALLYKTINPGSYLLKHMKTNGIVFNSLVESDWEINKDKFGRWIGPISKIKNVNMLKLLNIKPISET